MIDSVPEVTCVDVIQITDRYALVMQTKKI